MPNKIVATTGTQYDKTDLLQSQQQQQFSSKQPDIQTQSAVPTTNRTPQSQSQQVSRTQSIGTSNRPSTSDANRGSSQSSGATGTQPRTPTGVSQMRPSTTSMPSAVTTVTRTSTTSSKPADNVNKQVWYIKVNYVVEIIPNLVCLFCNVFCKVLCSVSL